GSGEARAIAAALADRDDLRVTASVLLPALAGPLKVPTRTGGFGGDDGFAQFLDREGVSAVLDATHPFAARIGQRSAPISAAKGIPYARVLRPAWQAEPGDLWTHVPDESAAGALLHAGQRVFATTGRATMERLVTKSPAQFLLRRRAAEPGAPTVPNVSYVIGQGPFSVDDEIATLRAHRIDVLVAKNSGGTASCTKLDAARALGLPVILVDRPEQVRATTLTTVAQALEWVEGLA
ncbi:MAG: precorrin-6A/cobalt-precorrin-6A reductase, partial [Pseudomonadota bacterium]|nr:precorrin-6A/cobalt-precorrin-6A reductase [Pseudomonadota bacterium]